MSRPLSTARAMYRLISCLTALWLTACVLSGCVGSTVADLPAERAKAVTTGDFVLPDGVRVPYRAWLADGWQDAPPKAVVLALHGMNDSRDAWEYPAPEFARAGIAVFAPDQRGFGATDARGYWSDGDTMAHDARAMAEQLRERYPHSKLILMGESMGAAVLMVLAAEPDPPPVDGYVLIAPAVWGRAEMNAFLRAGLWLFSHTMPGMKANGAGFVRVKASDNREAIRRLSNDPLTIHGARWDVVRGLVDLMDEALASAQRFNAPALFMYGGHDELIPPKATAATWRALPAGSRQAFYPEGYHLLLRDMDRITPIEDVMAWIMDHDTALPSGADRAAAEWLAKQE
ncbi:MAG: lysophospholipase [Acetobacteraceae bacterium]|nr:lysophospholipase [Acetobacteraceae bacterium]